MATDVKSETINKAGWAGLRRFHGTLEPTESKYIVPMGSFTPTMAVSVFVAPEDLSADDAVQSKAAMAYFDVKTRELLVFTATSSQKTSGTITFDLVVMGMGY
jgi:hypothetical protein